MKILVTGGSGALGRELVRGALAAGYGVRVMSRGVRPASAPAGAEWARADLLTGDGLTAALVGVDAVIHAASDPRRAEAVDRDGTRLLAGSAAAAGVGHLVYVSIVGIDQIPVDYYRQKLAAERAVLGSNLPHTVLRLTQFHSFVDALIGKAARVPLVMPLPSDFKFQSVDVGEAASRLLECLGDGPRGRAADFGGPEVLSLGEMAAAWREARGVRKRPVHLPLPGAAAAALRAGKNTAPDGRRGTSSWREWLDRGRPAGRA